jgi:hypothetical protein
MITQRQLIRCPYCKAWFWALDWDSECPECRMAVWESYGQIPEREPKPDETLNTCRDSNRGV